MGAEFDKLGYEIMEMKAKYYYMVTFEFMKMSSATTSPPRWRPSSWERAATARLWRWTTCSRTSWRRASPTTTQPPWPRLSSDFPRETRSRLSLPVSVRRCVTELRLTWSRLRAGRNSTGSSSVSCKHVEHSLILQQQLHHALSKRTVSAEIPS